MVRKEDHSLMEACEWGSEIIARGRVLNHSDQLVNARTFGDLLFRMTP